MKFINKWNCSTVNSKKMCSIVDRSEANRRVYSVEGYWSIDTNKTDLTSPDIQINSREVKYVDDSDVWSEGDVADEVFNSNFCMWCHASISGLNVVLETSFS